MYFRMLDDPKSGALTYLLADTSAREAVLIDPRSSDMALFEALLAEHDLRLRWTLRTHHHDLVPQPEMNALARLGAPLVQGDQPDSTVGMDRDDGSFLPFGNELMRVVSTPGHTPHCLSFAWRDRFFCGDVLALDACPDQAYPQQPQVLWESVTHKVFVLPDETLLFAGHAHQGCAVSTVLQQRRWHPFFAGVTRDEFLAHVAAAQGDNRAEFV